MITEATKSDSSFIHTHHYNHHFGTAFLLLALFSGALGGIMALPITRPFIAQESATTHAFLMSFFVIFPAFLGGICQWLLPKMLKAKEFSLPSCLTSSWCLLALGIIFLPLKAEIGMSFWALGSLPLALHIIINILENRNIPFRHFSPFIWSALFTASSIIIISPIIFALILKNYSLAAFLPVLHIPSIILMLIPALGLVSLIIPHQTHSSQRASLHKAAPYLISVASLILPLLWSDYLFGGIIYENASNFYNILNNLTAIITLLYLATLCLSLWRHALPFKAMSLWSLTTIISLMLGAILSPKNMHYHQSSHQLLVFGCLFAIFTGFYSWFEQIFTIFQNLLPALLKKKISFEIWGISHLVITACGLLSFLLFPLNILSLCLILLSILGFILMGLLTAHLFLKSNFSRTTTSFSSHQNI